MSQDLKNEMTTTGPPTQDEAPQGISNNSPIMIAEDFNIVEGEGWDPPIPMGNDLSWVLENDVFFDPAAEDSMDFVGFM